VKTIGAKSISTTLLPRCWEFFKVMQVISPGLQVLFWDLVNAGSSRTYFGGRMTT
jgi:hypothetical protein